MTALTIIPFLCALVCAISAEPPPTAALDPVYQFPNGTWIENIAVRQNGALLVTLATAPELWEISPLNSTARLVHRFPNATYTTGITPLAPDIYAICAGSAIWHLDLTDKTSTNSSTTSATPSASPIATIPHAPLLNGLLALPNSTRLLASDSTAGVVWAVDVATGDAAVVLADAATMAPPANVTNAIGVNGIRYLAGYVYYASTTKRLFCRVPVDAASGVAVGGFEVVREGLMGDDFAVVEEGGDVVGYVAGLDENVVTRVGVDDGGVEVVAGGKEERGVAGATSVAVGRGDGDGGLLLYVTTSGALRAPVGGWFVEGGKVVGLRVG